MVAVTKRYGLSLLLALSTLLVTLLVRPETLVGPVFLLAVILSAWLGGVGPGVVTGLFATLTIPYLFLPPKNTLRFNPLDVHCRRIELAGNIGVRGTLSVFACEWAPAEVPRRRLTLRES
jgi:hypothetical protein